MPLTGRAAAPIGARSRPRRGARRTGSGGGHLCELIFLTDDWRLDVIHPGLQHRGNARVRCATRQLVLATVSLPSFGRSELVVLHEGWRVWTTLAPRAASGPHFLVRGCPGSPGGARLSRG